MAPIEYWWSGHFKLRDQFSSSYPRWHYRVAITNASGGTTYSSNSVLNVSTPIQRP